MAACLWGELCVCEEVKVTFLFSVCPALCSTLYNLHITFTTVSEVSVNIWKLRHHKVKSETPQLVGGGAVFVPDLSTY